MTRVCLCLGSPRDQHERITHADGCRRQFQREDDRFECEGLAQSALSLSAVYSGIKGSREDPEDARCPGHLDSKADVAHCALEAVAGEVMEVARQLQPVPGCTEH